MAVAAAFYGTTIIDFPRLGHVRGLGVPTVLTVDADGVIAEVLRDQHSGSSNDSQSSGGGRSSSTTSSTTSTRNTSSTTTATTATISNGTSTNTNTGIPSSTFSSTRSSSSSSSHHANDCGSDVDPRRWLPPSARLQSKLAALEAAGVVVRRLGAREFLTPGFVDCHTHCAQWPFAGTGVDRPLMAADGFLAAHAFPTEASLKDEELAREYYDSAVLALLSHGTTTAMMYASVHVAASLALGRAALAAGGPRAFVGKVCMDRHCPAGYVEDTAASLAAAEQFILATRELNVQHHRRCREVQASAAAAANAATVGAQTQTQQWAPVQAPVASACTAAGQGMHTQAAALLPLVEPVVTPRFLPTCSPELLAGLGALARRHSAPVQTHLSESLDELAFSRSLFPQFASDAAALAAFGLLRRKEEAKRRGQGQGRGEDQGRGWREQARVGVPPSRPPAAPPPPARTTPPAAVMGHAVHLQRDEVALLRDAGAAVAHCPLSNFFFAGGTLPVRQLVTRAGVLVGLGTDVAGGYSPSMLAAVRAAVLASKTLQFRRDAAGRPAFCGADGRLLDRLAAAAGSASGGGGGGGGGGDENSTAPWDPSAGSGAAAVATEPATTTANVEDGARTGQDEAEKLRAAHDLSHFDAMFLATQGGAAALGIGDLTGSFDPGKAFDALVLAAVPPNVRAFREGTAEGAAALLQKVIALGDDRNVVEVYVGGLRVNGSVPPQR